MNYLLPIFTACYLLLSCSSAVYSLSISSKEDTQLRVYKETLIQIRKGQLNLAARGMHKLQDYPLIPYAEKALLYKNIQQVSNQQAQLFLTRYSSSVPARQFRKKWLSHLAKNKRWQSFLQFYIQEDASIEAHCHHLEALHQQGKINSALIHTNKLWVTEKSLPSACDKPFKRWQRAGLRTNDIVWERAKLAITANNYTLARYLAKTSAKDLKPHINKLINIYQRPGKLSDISKFSSNSIYEKDIVISSTLQLANKDVESAIKLWPYYAQKFNFSPKEIEHIKQTIGRNLIASGNPKALSWLIKNDPNGDDLFLLEWRILLAIKQQQWSTAERWISLLPQEQQQKSQWQYWLAKTQIKQNPDSLSAYSLFDSLSQQRHYYGFLAAKYLNKRINLEQRALPSDIDTASMALIPAIERAQLFYQMNEVVAARREWHNATKDFSPELQLTASVLAQQWQWHQQVILSSTKASHKDDLNLRFPLAYQDNILPAAKKTKLQPEWIYAITRQESAFATDAYSSAGAKGLMQLLPATAKQIANQSGVKFKHTDIYKANTNIVLGSHYLQSLMTIFQGNKILATAAFNAGPYRVKRWLQRQTQELDYDIWIDTLPYHETRNYIKNVLASSVIYGHRLGKEINMVENHEEVITYQKEKY
ncbi:MAG: soluble lytic murein transglycosylase [Pseudohongiellaceae bacterium]|jgi:soluble lytic murein transglycosylase